ncbi:MAG: hypothetical protein WCT12_01915 [Verrucomicrobiota bacterium]
MIRYALDQHYLPDADYIAFGGTVQNAQQLSRSPWLTSLYWVRRCFEHGDGNNHREQLRTVFTGPQNQFEDLVNHIFGICGFPLDDGNVKPRQRFLSECFTVGFHGQTSEIWKFLVPLYRRIEAAATDPANWGLLRAFANTEGGDLPPFFRWLIDTEDTDFLAMLRAMATNQDQNEPWLVKILASPNYTELRERNSATVGWAIYQNGNVCDLRLVVRNIQLRNNWRTCEVRQNAAVLEKQLQAGQTMIALSVQELVRSGLHIFEKVQVQVGGHRVPGGARLGNGAVQCPVLFRFPLGGGYYHSQVTVDDEHISAKRLLALLPEGFNDANAGFTFGGQPCAATRFRVLNLCGQPRHLVQLNLDAWDGSTRELQWEQQVLVSLGTQPYLEVAQAIDGIQVKAADDTALVLGETSHVEVKNCPNQADVQWSIDGNPAGNGAACLVQRSASQEAKILCRVAGRTRTVRIIFVPANAEAWIRGTQPEASNDWSWQPEVATARRIEAAQEGRQEGTLAFQGLNWRVSAPLAEPLWYWQEGIQPATEVNKFKEFNSWGEVMNWTLYVCLPPHNEATVLDLRLDGNPAPIALQPLQPGDVFPISVSYLCQPHLAFDNLASAGFAYVSLRGQQVACVLNVPTQPVLIRNQGGHPSVFFPEGFTPGNYSILRLRESLLVSGALEAITCAGFGVGQLTAIPTGTEARPDEGVWLALIPEPQNQAPPNLLLLAWQCRQLDQGRLALLQASAAGGDALRARLEHWHGPLNDQQVGMARNCLDMLDGCFGNHPDTPFAAAIKDRAELHIPAGWWRSNFVQQCRLDSLGDTLPQSLRNGFNWCAEPGSLGEAYRQIRETIQGNWTEARRQRLVETCPAIAAQILIEHGFPLVQAQQGNRITASTGKIFRTWEWRDPALHGLLATINPQQGGQLLRLRTHHFWANGVGIRSVSSDGILLVGMHNQHIQVVFNYQGRQEMLYQHNVLAFEVGVNNEQHYLHAFADRIQEHDHHMLAAAAGQETMRNLFGECLISAQAMVGIDADEEYGLARMFSLASARFVEMAQMDESQANRALLFQAAVLSRLHARLGLAQAYPHDWPLSQPQNYQQVCGVIREAWFCEDCRQALMDDLIPVEWMITWFHR